MCVSVSLCVCVGDRYTVDVCLSVCVADCLCVCVADRYTVDETSPVISVEDAMFDELEGSTYQILSKPIKTLVSPVATPTQPVKSLVGSEGTPTQPIKTVGSCNKTSAS